MEFRINAIYSNEHLCEKAWETACNYNNFILNLHKKHPEHCPYPYALQLHKEFKKTWKDKLFHYFVVVKRTKHYLTISFSYSPLIRRRHKIYTDPLGMEYIKLDGIEVNAFNYVVSSVDLEEQKYFPIKREMVRNLTYIRQMEHLEQYGYVYMDNATRITAIDDLQRHYKDAEGWSTVITEQ